MEVHGSDKMKMYKGNGRVTIVMSPNGTSCPALTVRGSASSRLKDDYYGKVSMDRKLMKRLTLL